MAFAEVCGVHCMLSATRHLHPSTMCFLLGFCMQQTHRFHRTLLASSIMNSVENMKIQPIVVRILDVRQCGTLLTLTGKNLRRYQALSIVGVPEFLTSFQLYLKWSYSSS
ncbi:hypothetical protein Ancab_028765 [Ancistrocladus abbreviatus]